MRSERADNTYHTKIIVQAFGRSVMMSPTATIAALVSYSSQMALTILQGPTSIAGCVSVFWLQRANLFCSTAKDSLQIRRYRCMSGSLADW